MKYIIIFLYLIISVNLNSLDIKNKLINGVWYSNFKMGYRGTQIIFNEDSTVIVRVSSIGSKDDFKGIYKIENNTVKINLDSYKKLTDYWINYLSGLTKDLRIENNSTNIISNTILFNDKNTFYDLNKLKKINEVGFIDNYKLINMGYKKGNINSKAFIREYPNIKANNYSFTYISEKNRRISKNPFLPINYTVTVIGRTDTLEKIKNLEGYWYYVEIIIIYPGFGEEIFINNKQIQSDRILAWIYGPLITME